MVERVDGLERALTALGGEIEVPAAPPVAPAVMARLRTERAARARPPFPGLARWPRRRILALAAVGLVALLALAAAARLSIGAVGVRIQPTPSPTGAPPPPENPVAFGREVTLAEARAALGFPLALPSGPLPDHAFLFTTPFDRPGALLAWEPSATYGQISGLPWGLLVMELRGQDEVLLKTLGSIGSLHDVRVGGEHAWWITDPHELTIQIDVGTRTYSVSGHVLIWQRGDVTYRMETTLELAAAKRLATSVG